MFDNVLREGLPGHHNMVYFQRRGQRKWSWTEKIVDQSVTTVSVSARDDIVVLQKAHMHSAPFLNSLSKASLKTVPSANICLVEGRSFPTLEGGMSAVPSSTPFSFRQSMLSCSGLSIKFLKPLSTSAQPSCRPDVISAMLASLFAGSCPGQ